MYRVLIYDDIFEHADELKKLICNMHPDADVHISTDYNASETLLSENSYDILFLDIELDNEMNGIRFAEKLQNNGCKALLVYITAYTRYYEDISLTRPDAFLSKPFTALKVKRVMDIIRKKILSKSFLIINSSRNNVEKIRLDTTAYISHENRYLVFYDMNRNITCKFYDKKLSDIEGMLPEIFVRCHHSFAVNMKYAVQIKRFYFVMEGGYEINISQSRFSVTRKKFISYLEDTV